MLINFRLFFFENLNFGYVKIVDMVTWTCCIFCKKNNGFPIFPKMWTCFLEILTKTSIFKKWLPRPNHYARSIRLGILCRTPVSKFQELSYESKSKLKTPNIVPQPGDGGGDDDDIPRTLPIWQEPWSITHRNQISRSGIPHFDSRG